jgi:hypothetical protein
MFDSNVVLSYCLPKESERFRIETKNLFDLIKKKRIKSYIIKSIENECLKKIEERTNNLIIVLREIYQDILMIKPKSDFNSIDFIEKLFSIIRERCNIQKKNYYSILELIERNFINDFEKNNRTKQDKFFQIYQKILYQALEIQTQVQIRLSEVPYEVKDASGREYDKKFEKMIVHKSDRHHFCNCYKFCKKDKKNLMFISYDNEHFLSKKREVENNFSDIIITSPLYAKFKF